MSVNVVAVMLSMLGIYLFCGVLFAIQFVLVGTKRIDPHAVNGTWGFRLLIIPGATFLWPLLLKRLLSGVLELPQEKNPHRCAARKEAHS